MKIRRGVGEILGSLMILLIVAVAGAVLLNLSMTTSYANQNSLLSETKTQEDISQERFVVLSVNRESSNTFGIAFYNYGKVDVKITDVYINNDHVKLSSSVICYPTEYVWIHNINYNGLNPYSEYRIAIVSDRGVSVEFNWRT